MKIFSTIYFGFAIDARLLELKFRLGLVHRYINGSDFKKLVSNDRVITSCVRECDYNQRSLDLINAKYGIKIDINDQFDYQNVKEDDYLVIAKKMVANDRDSYKNVVCNKNVERGLEDIIFNFSLYSFNKDSEQLSFIKSL
jgi:hypothetical protein